MAPAAAGAAVSSGRIYGYARASSDKQVKSLSIQESMISAKAAKLDGRLVKIYTDEAISAYDIRWEERHGFRALMEVLQAGDHLIVWRLDRIERNMFGMLDALRRLVDRGVAIHILKYGEVQLDLDAAMGRLMLMIFAGLAEFFLDQRSESVKRATPRSPSGQSCSRRGSISDVSGRTLPHRSWLPKCSKSAGTWRSFSA